MAAREDLAQADLASAQSAFLADDNQRPHANCLAPPNRFRRRTPGWVLKADGHRRRKAACPDRAANSP